MKNFSSYTEYLEFMLKEEREKNAALKEALAEALANNDTIQLIH